MKVNILGTALNSGVVGMGKLIGCGEIDYDNSHKIVALHMKFKEGYSQDALNVHAPSSEQKTLYVLVQDKSGNLLELSGGTVDMHNKGYTLKVCDAQKI